MTSPSPTVDDAILTTAVDGLPFGVVLMRLETADDPSTFRILYANARLGVLLGIDITPLVGMLSIEAFPSLLRSGHLERCMEALRVQRTLETEPLEYRDEPFSKDTYSTLVVPIRHDVVMMLMEDQIAYRNETEEARKHEQRFQRLLESAPDAMMIMDANARIQLVNARAEHVFGFSRSELMGQPLERIIPGDLPGHVQELAAHSAKALDPRKMGQGIELEGYRKDGSAFPIEVTLSPLELEGELSVSAAIRDITERKKNQEAQRHLSAIIRSSNDAIISKDRNGIITSWNTGAELVFGYAAKEVVGEPITILFPPEKLHEEKAIEQSVLVEGGRVQHYETVRLRKDGTMVDVSLTISPIRNEQGEIIGASKFAHDITDRKKAEKEIRELNRTLELRVSERTEQVERSEKRFHNALDSMMEGVSIIGFDWRYIYANDTTVARSPFKREELIGRSLLEVYPGIEQHPLFGVLERCMNARVAETVESEFQFPNGRTAHFALSIQPAIDGLFILSTDITERKAAEEALRNSEERYHRTLDQMMEGVQIVGYDWRYVYVNDAVVAQSTYSRAELLGHTMMEKYPGIERTPLFAVLENCMRDRTARSMDSVFHFPNGTTGIFQLSIQPMAEGLFILSTDITEKKKAEEALAKSEERFHNALDVLIEGVQIIGHDWRHLYVNDAGAAQSTFTKEQLLGTTMMERYPGIEESPVFAALQQCMSERLPRVMETDFTFPNGTTKTFHLSIQPITEGLFLLSTDITERKRAEVEVANQRVRLEQQNKDLEQFAFIASHDLQEPLRMVTSYVQLLQRRYGDKLDRDANEFIGFAVDGTLRMKQLITDLLAYSRMGREVDIADVDMDIVLQQARANLATALMEWGAVLTSDPLPAVRASQTEMLQVLQNLIGNAVKFRRKDVAPVVHVTGREEGDHWRFDVADNGIGIEAQYNEKVFVPFKRLHDKTTYSGSGIGLAVAQKIVQRFGGRIWFTSEPGQGTTFHFTIKRRTL